jgi:hypothetical protein
MQIAIDKKLAPNCVDRLRSFVDDPANKTRPCLSLTIPALTALCDFLFWCLELSGSVKALSSWQKGMLVAEAVVACASGVGTVIRSQGVWSAVVPLPLLPVVFLGAASALIIHLALVARKHVDAHIPLAYNSWAA